MRIRDAVEDTCDADRVVWSTPSVAFERESARQRLIHVGEGRRFDIAVAMPARNEQAEVRGKLLLDVQADAGAGGIPAHCRMLAGPPTICANWTESLNRPKSPRVRNPVTATFRA